MIIFENSPVRKQLPPRAAPDKQRQKPMMGMGADKSVYDKVGNPVQQA